MNRQTILTKTAKGLMEATGKTSDLSRDLRNLLKEIDGKVSVGQLQMRQELFTEAKFMEALSRLERDGYVKEFSPLQDEAPPSRPGVRAPASAPPSNAGEDLDFTAIASKPAARSGDARPRTDDHARREADERARKQAAERAKAEADARARSDAAARARAEAERLAAEKARADAAARAKAEADAREQAQALERARKQAEERAEREAQERARREAAERARREAEERARRETEERIRREAEERARRDAEERARREAEERARREAEERARREAEERARRRAEEERAQREAEERIRREIEERERREQEARERREREEEQRREEEERRHREAEARARAAEVERALARGPKSGASELEEAMRLERIEAEEKTRRENEERVRREEEEHRRAAEEARRGVKVEAEDAEAEMRRREEEMRRREEEEAARAKEEREARAAAEAETLAQMNKEARAREKAIQEEQRRTEAEERRRQKAAKSGTGLRRRVALGKPIAIGSFFILVIGAAALPFVPLDVTPYEQAAENWLGMPVRIGAVTVSLVPTPQLKFEKVTIGKEPQMRIAVARATPDLGSLLDDRKTLRAVEIEGAVVPQQILSALVYGRAGGTPLGIERVTGKAVKLEIPGFAVPDFDLKATLGSDGALRNAELSNAERKLSVTLQPEAGRMAVEMSAENFSLPIGGDLVVDEFSAKGALGRSELVFNRFEGRALGGLYQGNARLRWSDGWNLDGEFLVKQMDASKIAAPILASGTLEGKGVYAMKASAPNKLFSGTRLEGNFTVQKGSISNVDMTRILQGSSTGGGTTLFSEMSGSAIADSGRVHVRQLHMAAGLMQGAGGVEMDGEKNLSGRIQIELRAQTTQARATVAVFGTLRDPQFKRAN